MKALFEAAARTLGALLTVLAVADLTHDPGWLRVTGVVLFAILMIQLLTVAGWAATRILGSAREEPQPLVRGEWPQLDEDLEAFRSQLATAIQNDRTPTLRYIGGRAVTTTGPHRMDLPPGQHWHMPGTPYHVHSDGSVHDPASLP